LLIKVNSKEFNETLVQDAKNPHHNTPCLPGENRATLAGIKRPIYSREAEVDQLTRTKEESDRTKRNLFGLGGQDVSSEIFTEGKR